MRVTTTVSPAFALMLDAIAPEARPRVDHGDWSSELWDRTLDIAAWHRLSPILFRHLRSNDDVPRAVLETLERAYLENAARNAFLRDALERALQALAAADVPAMLLKGAALVETVYSDPAEREMLDLDILV